MEMYIDANACTFSEEVWHSRHESVRFKLLSRFVCVRLGSARPRAGKVGRSIEEDIAQRLGYRLKLGPCLARCAIEDSLADLGIVLF